MLQRCEENIEQLEEWIDEKPNRDKENKILDDLKYITTELEKFIKTYNSTHNARSFFEGCKPKLINIGNTLGTTDELYIRVSSWVVNNTQSMLISVVNEYQEGYTNLNDGSFGDRFKCTLQEFYNVVFDAIEISKLILSINLTNEVSTKINLDINALNGIMNQIDRISKKYKKDDGSCYIATMAFGSYNHPQVLVLRQFRDEVLNKSALGQSFIKTYYQYSPLFVKRLKNKKVVNSIIRKALNQFIKLIK